MAKPKHVQTPAKPVALMVNFAEGLDLDARKAAVRELGGIPQDVGKLLGMFVTILVARADFSRVLGNYINDPRIIGAELRKS